MDTTKGELETLFKKYLDGELGRAEFEKLWSSLKGSENKAFWMQMIKDVWDSPANKNLATESIKKAALKKIRRSAKVSENSIIPGFLNRILGIWICKKRK